jgi:hypothetical protein
MEFRDDSDKNSSVYFLFLRYYSIFTHEFDLLPCTAGHVVEWRWRQGTKACATCAAMAQLQSTFCTLLLLLIASIFRSGIPLSVSFLPTRRTVSRRPIDIPTGGAKSTTSKVSIRRGGINKRGMMAGESDGGMVGQMRGGLTFLKTRDRPGIVGFYRSQIGMEVWLEQPDITILSFGNFLVGFHHKPDEDPDLAGMYTFVYPTKAAVDAMYGVFKATTADGPPRVNTTYRIYQFFATDPEGRRLEFQAFLHPLDVVSSAVLGDS